MPAITSGRCMAAIWETPRTGRCAPGHEGKPKLWLAGTVLAEELEEPLKDADPIPQLLQVELLIRGVQPVVGEPDSREQHGSALAPQRRDDGDRTPSTRRDDA